MGVFSRFRKSKTVDEPTLTVEVDEDKEDIDYTVQLNRLTLNAVDVMADMVYRSCYPEGWFLPPPDPSVWSNEVITGVTLRSKHGSIRSCPGEHPGFAAFEHAIVQLNARIAIKLQSKAVDVAMKDYMLVQFVNK
jgi:ribosome-associated translation inhibitor RaiA